MNEKSIGALFEQLFVLDIAIEENPDDQVSQALRHRIGNQLQHRILLLSQIENRELLTSFWRHVQELKVVLHRKHRIIQEMDRMESGYNT